MHVSEVERSAAPNARPEEPRSECSPDTKFSETLKMGSAVADGYVPGRHGSVTVYPVRKTIKGSCVNHLMGRTDWGTVDAQYTTKLYRNEFGE